VTLIQLPQARKGGVVCAALRDCDADLLGYVDADGATPPRELLRLADAVDRGADAAIACRRHPASVVPARRPLTRRVASRGFSATTRLMLGLPHPDTQCGAKVMRREAPRTRRWQRVRTSGLSFDVDLLLAARDLGQRVVEVPTIWVDKEGSRVRPLRDTRRMGGSLVGLWARAGSPPFAATIACSPMPPDVALISPYPPPGERHGRHSGVASTPPTSRMPSPPAAPRSPSSRRAAARPPAITTTARSRCCGALTPGARGRCQTRPRAPSQRGAGRAPAARAVSLWRPASGHGLAPALGALRRATPRTWSRRCTDRRPADRRPATSRRCHRVAVPPALARLGLGGVQSALARLSNRCVVHERGFAAQVRGAVVVPHGVERRRAGDRAQARQALGLAPDQLLALCFGFLAPNRATSRLRTSADVGVRDPRERPHGAPFAWRAAARRSRRPRQQSRMLAGRDRQQHVVLRLAPASIATSRPLYGARNPKQSASS